MDVIRFTRQVEETLKELYPYFIAIEDIHRHTRDIGMRTGIILAQDQISKISDHQAVKASILHEAELKQVEPMTLQHIKRVLETITNSIEGETQLNVADLLTRVWGLAVEEGDHGIDAVLINLELNILDGGGCLAGISARLCQVYLQQLAIRLEKISRTDKPSCMP